MNFSELNDLISEGLPKIVLDSDVFLDGGECITIDTDELIIDGAGHTIDAGGKSRAFTIKGGDVKIKNLTIKNGFGGMCGGAIRNSANLTIYRSRFEDNKVEVLGGAILSTGNLAVYSSVFKRNFSKALGGAIHNRAGSVMLEGCTFDSNRAISGAAASNLHGVMGIFESRFCKNDAQSGGAIYNRGSGPRHVDRIGWISRKRAWRLRERIRNDGRLEVAGCEFENNAADYGAAIYSNEANLRLASSIFAKNECDLKGGAIYSNHSFAIFDCQFTGNSACCGGALYCTRLRATHITIKMSNTMLSKNTARQKGGAVYMDCGYLDSKNSSFEDNSPDDVFENDED